MDDKNLMEDVLLTVKGACDLYLHGTIESSTANVHNTFDQRLNEIYNKMSEKGWYPMETAQTQQIDKVKQKYAASVN